MRARGQRPTASPSFSLDGRVALVTGGTSGIGRGIARGLADAGAAVAVAARTRSGVEEAARTLRDSGHRAVGVVADVTGADEVRHMVDTVVDELGTVDVLVNCVGGSSGPGFGHQPLLDIDDDAFDRCFRFNVKTQLYAAQCVAPLMLARGRGSIINVASVQGRGARVPRAGGATYSMAKAAVVQLTYAMAIEWAPAIRANCIAPGLVATEGGLKRADERTRDAFLSRMALPRPGQPEDVAGAAVFLASDASAWMTGVTVDVNGGAGLASVTAEERLHNIPY